MSTWIPHDLPHPPDVDHAAEREEKLWQHYCAVAQRLDVGELITAVCHELRGEPGHTPLSALIEEWLAWPQFDWQHPLIRPSTCESLGRWLAGLVAEVLQRAIETALARETSHGDSRPPPPRPPRGDAVSLSTVSAPLCRGRAVSPAALALPLLRCALAGDADRAPATPAPLTQAGRGQNAHVFAVPPRPRGAGILVGARPRLDTTS
jgi:hypothetical protein